MLAHMRGRRRGQARTLRLPGALQVVAKLHASRPPPHQIRRARGDVHCRGSARAPPARQASARDPTAVPASSMLPDGQSALNPHPAGPDPFLHSLHPRSALIRVRASRNHNARTDEYPHVEPNAPIVNVPEVEIHSTFHLLKPYSLPAEPIYLRPTGDAWLDVMPKSIVGDQL
jgi:hypothetical protein